MDAAPERFSMYIVMELSKLNGLITQGLGNGGEQCLGTIGEGLNGRE